MSGPVYIIELLPLYQYTKLLNKKKKRKVFRCYRWQKMALWFNIMSCDGLACYL